MEDRKLLNEFKKNKAAKFWFWMGLVLIGLHPTSSEGEVVFSNKPTSQSQPIISEYPDSWFGRAPEQPVISEKATDTAYQRLDQTSAERESGGAGAMGRSPASTTTKLNPYQMHKSPKLNDSEGTLYQPKVNYDEVVYGAKQTQVSDLIPDRTKGVQEVSLIAGDLGYFPRTLFVTRDIPVRIFVTGASKATLCIMMDSFQVSKQIRAEEIKEIAFTPKTPGKYRFYCPINGMEGTLVVRELASVNR